MLKGTVFCAVTTVQNLLYYMNELQVSVAISYIIRSCTLKNPIQDLILEMDLRVKHNK